MAAIDKLYLKSWHEFDRLVRWSICYYPQLLNYMYDWRMTYKDWKEAANKSDAELEDDYSLPVMNTRWKIDHKLLWICPLPEVRKYLYEQCGYSKRWEQIYKIFWRGKYEFTYNEL